MYYSYYYCDIIDDKLIGFLNEKKIKYNTTNGLVTFTVDKRTAEAGETIEHLR